MSLLVRINLVLGVVSAAAACARGLCVLDHPRGQRAARGARRGGADDGERRGHAGVYGERDLAAARAADAADSFLPQSIPFYAATQNFLKLRERHPDYTYKEATLNPTNPRDRAADWEADIIQRFRNDGRADEVVGERDTPMGKSLYLARPIRTDAECADATARPLRRRPTWSRATAGTTASAGNRTRSSARTSSRCRSPAPRPNAARAFQRLRDRAGRGFRRDFCRAQRAAVRDAGAPGPADRPYRRPAERGRLVGGGISAARRRRNRLAGPLLQPHAHEPRQGAAAAGPLCIEPKS